MSEEFPPLRARLRSFALRIVNVCDALPQNNKGWVLGKQLLRSGTSIGANYTESQRASSRNHFISILETSLREADETKWWLELISDSGMLSPTALTEIQSECAELIRILASSINSAKRNREN